jgi:hypothetical protein
LLTEAQHCTYDQNWQLGFQGAFASKLVSFLYAYWFLLIMAFFFYVQFQSVGSSGVRDIRQVAEYVAACFT